MADDLRSPPIRIPSLLQQEARPWASCGLAAVAVLAGLACRLALGGMLGDQAVFLFFVPGIVIAAAWGGLWPGLLATVLGAAAGLWVGARAEASVQGVQISAVVFLAWARR